LSALRELNGRYSGLFSKESGQGNGESEEDIEEVNQEEESYFQKWGWIITLDSLSQGDHSKWEYYTNLGVIEFLNVVSFQKDKTEWQRSLNQ
jgi:uncharacterized protein YfaT (DUF1175 family)